MSKAPAVIMDHFGIGTALLSVASVYFRSGRQTGRTTSLADSLKDGDRVIFADQATADQFMFKCRDRQLKVECIFAPPDEHHRLNELGTCQGRTLFDHTWVERFYLLQIESATKQISGWQSRLSGYGEAHYETRRRAEELMRWGNF